MAETPTIPKAPVGLKARGRQLWRELHTTYDFTDCPEKLIIFEQAARTADVVHRLQSIVDAADDLRVKGSQGQPVAAPEVGELRQYRALLTSLLKALTLPDDEGPGRNRQDDQEPARTAWGTSTVGREGALMGRPKRRNRCRANDPEALASRLPDELRSFDGWLYPNGLRDYMSALSRFVGGTQRLTPVMDAAGLSAASWFRQMLTTASA